jgi:hypothetical protein
MSEPGTRAFDADVEAFLGSLDDERTLADCRELVDIMSAATGQPPRMWGTSIVGFGSYHYRYASGREGDCHLTGFSPRRQGLSIYIMPGFSAYAPLMKKLGKHRIGKSCLYVKKLADVDRDVLRRLVERSVADMRGKYGGG